MGAQCSISPRLFYAQNDPTMQQISTYLSRLHVSLLHLLKWSGTPLHLRVAAGLGIAALVTTGVLIYVVRSRHPSAEELERRRREDLALSGRLTDGSIVNARSFDGEESVAHAPDVLLYRYRIAGVTYDCGQDVSSLPEYTIGYRIDQPVQVRYDPRNPGNSIIVSEVWSGLRMKPQLHLAFAPDEARMQS